MPEFTEHERAQLHAMARQQIRLITQMHLVDSVKSLSDVTYGVLKGLAMAEALRPDELEQLTEELVITTFGHTKKLISAGAEQ